MKGFETLRLKSQYLIIVPIFNHKPRLYDEGFQLLPTLSISLLLLIILPKSLLLDYLQRHTVFLQYFVSRQSV